jgi:RNA polymerase sigma-70 factor (ECF subfamily)
VWVSLVVETGRIDEDQALVDAVRGGDGDAFARLVRKYQNRVIGLAHGLLADRRDAEDVAQEAFLRAYKGLRGFRAHSSFRTWLFQIVVNTARTHRARRSSRMETAVDEVTLESAPASERLETAVVTRDEITHALTSLPPDLREAVLLRDVEGLDYREIARTLDVPIGTVESRIFRGRERLRRALRPAEGQRHD